MVLCSEAGVAEALSRRDVGFSCRIQADAPGWGRQYDRMTARCWWFLAGLDANSPARRVPHQAVCRDGGGGQPALLTSLVARW